MGTGKSCLCARLQAVGREQDDTVSVVSVDEIRKRILTEPSYLRTQGQVCKEFPGISRRDGSIDRQRLAGIVFGSRRAMQVYEGIIEPVIQDELYRLITPREGLVLLEYARLAETRATGLGDTTLLLTCDPDVQMERLLPGDLPEEQVAKRIASQFSSAQKAKALYRRGRYLEIDTTGGISAHDVHQLYDLFSKGARR